MHVPLLEYIIRVRSCRSIAAVAKHNVSGPCLVVTSSRDLLLSFCSLADNIAGLNMGQQVIAENLAHHMAYTYGGEAECYQEKIDKLRFDWNTFNPRTCKVKYRWEEDEYW